ncbi:hypothetical protein MRX96_058280 [Rhipicephalus microplus]
MPLQPRERRAPTDLDGYRQHLATSQDKTISLLCTGTKEDPPYHTPALTKSMPLQPCPRRVPAEPDGYRQHLASCPDRTTKLLAPQGAETTLHMWCQRQLKSCPFNPDHDARRVPAEPDGYRQHLATCPYEQQNCSAMELGTTFHTMFQRRQKPCHFNSHPDTHAMNKIGIASTLLPALTEE